MATAFEVDAARVRAVVFDLGGVFLTGGVEGAIAFGTANGLAAEAWDAMRRELFVDEGHPWGRVERGETTLDAFAAELVRRFAAQGIDLPHERARNFMGRPELPTSRLRGEVVEACRALRARLSTALLTNNIREWRPGWQALLDTEALFDVVVDSSQVGLRKPEEGIYRLVEQALNLTGAALLFVDDQGVNLKGARRLGWQTLKYDDTARVLRVLRQVEAAAAG